MPGSTFEVKYFDYESCAVAGFTARLPSSSNGILKMWDRKGPYRGQNYPASLSARPAAAGGPIGAAEAAPPRRRRQHAKAFLVIRLPWRGKEWRYVHSGPFRGG